MSELQPIVETILGPVKGIQETTINGEKYNAFLGMPYAQPPLNHLRFKAPEAMVRRSDVWDATIQRNASYCFDPFTNSTQGSEDCLYLNVYTKTLPSKEDNGSLLKPVMVWIHGGGFVFGSGHREEYGPDHLVGHDIVLVSINYRLGAFGFLQLKDNTLGIHGNAGMKDQVMALRWVQDNISAFGGDPQNVTIFGESAGAVSVHLHILSQMSKGLFHKAILQSGSVLCPWAMGRPDGGRVLVELMGKPAASDNEILNALNAASSEEIIEAHKKYPDTMRPSVIRIMSPTIEDHDGEAFLSQEPLELLRSGNYNKVPMIMGYTSAEGLFLKTLEKSCNADFTFTNMEFAIPCTYKVQLGSAQSKEIAYKVKRFYYGFEEPAPKNSAIFYKIVSDVCYLRGIFLTMEEFLKTSGTDVYFYQLALECDLNQFAKAAGVTDNGVCHSEDLVYLFHNSQLSPKMEQGSVEDIAVRRMTTWWTNFAKRGNPNAHNNDQNQAAFLETPWRKSDLKHFSCLNIDKNITMQHKPEQVHMKFWKEIEKIVKY